MRRRSFVVVASLVMLSASGARGQAPAVPGNRVRLEVYGSARITPTTPTVLWTGQLVGFDGGQLRLVGTTGDSVSLARERIRSIQVWSEEQRRARGRSLAIGALVGGALGGVTLGLLAGSTLCEDECTAGGSAIVGFALGALSGGFLGLLLAPTRTHGEWHDAALPVPLGPRAGAPPGTIVGARPAGVPVAAADTSPRLP